MRWASLPAACSQLNKNPSAVRSLARLGCFRRRKSGAAEAFAIAVDDDKQSIVDRFYAKHSPVKDRETCLKVKKVIDVLYGKPSVSPPESFMNDAMSILHAAGDELENASLRALTGATIAVAKAHVIAWCAANGAETPETRTRFTTAAGDHEAVVMNRLPEELRSAPGTYLTPDSHPDCKPSEPMFARLAAIEDPTLFVATTLDVLRLAATKADAQAQNRSTLTFQRIDKRLVAGESRDPFAIRDALERELGPDWVSSKIAAGVASETVVRYLHVHDRLRDYIEQVVPAAQREVFRRYQLTMPAGHEKFFRQVKDAVRKYQKACEASRQKRIEHILDNPLQFLLVGRLRLLEHTLIRDACRAKIDQIIKSGKVPTEPVRFQITYETRLINDGFRRCSQTIHLEIWPWDLVHARLRAAVDNTYKKPAVYAGNREEDNGSRSGYVVAYLGVTPDAPGGSTQTPLIAEVADSFALHDTGGLDLSQRDRQAAALDRWQFSTRHTAAGGLPWFEQHRRHAVRDADALLTRPRADGTEGRVSLIPHDDFCHGLMFAHSAVFIAADAGCRTGETLLAPALPDKYEPVTDPNTGEVFKRFDSIGKYGHAVKPMMSPDTFKHFVNMIIEGAGRWHGGKIAPAVIPNSGFRRRGIKTVARYAFTVDDRMIGYAELATLCRTLYFGWHGLKGHDVRHLFNAMGRRAGISKEVRQRLLNHEDPRSVEIYGPATPTEASRQQMQLKRQTSDNMAKLLQQSADGLSDDMALALRELRRAEMNVGYYEEGGWLEQAEQYRREVEEWAEKLARATAEHNGASEVIRAERI